MVQLRKRRGRRCNWKAVVMSSWKAVFILLIAGVMIQTQYWAFSSDYDEGITIATPFIANTISTSKERRAIFMISMGKAAAKGKIVERCLLSIRRRGNWTGYVVLLTDAPPARYLPSQQQDDYLIIMHPRKQDFLVSWASKLSTKVLSFLKQQKRVNDMPYKRFKMMQLNYIDLDPRLANVHLVYYLDIDIVVGAPLQIFFDYIEDKYNIQVQVQDLGPERKRKDEYTDMSVSNKSGVSKAFFFMGNDDNFPVQGGQFILERPHSKYCMDQWLHLLDTTPKTTKDQTSLRILMEQIQNKTETNCELVLMEQHPHLYFPSNLNSSLDMKNMMKTETYKTLNHFKNTHTALLIEEDIQEKFIAALLNVTQKEGRDLGVAKKIIFKPGGR